MHNRPPVSLPEFDTLMRATNSGGNFTGWKMSELTDYIGGLSNPSKMPGFAYGIPADECGVGTKLRDVEGSTCSGCYAFHRGAYAWKGTIAAYYRRFDRLQIPFWSEAIAEILNRRVRKGLANSDVFRWHDSGDLLSVDHLAAIVKVATLCPDVRFWLPTREYKIVADYRKLHGDDSIPANLCIRMSAHMIGGKVPTFKGLTVSTVSSDDSYQGAHNCPSRFQDNSCGDCRACWSTEVLHVDYHLH